MGTSKTVLIVDDEADIQSSLGFALKDEGYAVITAESPATALKILQTQAVDIGLFDVWFPDGDGIELLQTVREVYPETIVVMMSGHGNIELALKAIRLGAYDFLEKPLELEKLLVVLRNVSEAHTLRSERRLWSREVENVEIVGQSPEIRSLRDAVAKAAAANAHVLVLGENGSGKELVARMLHKLSPRAAHPFVTVNCAVIGDTVERELFGVEGSPGVEPIVGRFEQAGQGTLFLDGIAELSSEAQGKILRVLEDRTFERVGSRRTQRTGARVVAATNADLAADVKAGRFREDLYFRLNVLQLTVPPLRARASDVPELAAHFVKVLARDYARTPAPKLSGELLTWMAAYDWPGNVRELRNLLERMIILGSDRELLGIADLPEELQPAGGVATAASGQSATVDPGGTLRDIRSRFEHEILRQRLEKLSFNVTRTAESLGIERAHLHRKLKQHGITTRGDA